MNWNLFWIFVALNIVNVIVQTIKSIATLKCGKTAAAIINAFAYGFYTIVTIYMLCDLPLFWKAGIVALCNLIGVYIVKWGEEKARKDKLWKVEATVLRGYTNELHATLVAEELSHNYLENVGKYTLFNIFCATQAESAKAKKILDSYDAKYFVSESKTL
jgi:hypothetical protein